MKSNLVQLDDLGNHLNGDIDLFICSASYEMRCRSLADHLPKDRIRRAIVAETDHAERYISDNGDYLRAKLGNDTIAVTLNTKSPVDTADALWRSLRNGLQNPRNEVLVDITTFTHESLLILIKLLVLRAKDLARVRFAYVTAEEYSVGDADEDKWLSKGVNEVRSVLGYAGIILPSRRQHLIVLVGFEHERATELIKTYEPNLISLGHGLTESATHERHDAANRHFHRLVALTASTYGEVRSFEFACNNPIEAQTAIEKQIRAARGYNTIVAPLNTKLSTIGAVLAAQRDEAIQLCYARANQYNYRAYSLPSSRCHILEIPELFILASRHTPPNAPFADEPVA